MACDMSMTSSPTPAVLPDARAQSQAFWDAAQECLRVGEETKFAAHVTEEYRNGYKAACTIMSMPLQHMASRAARGLPWNDTPPASDAAVPAGASHAWAFIHKIAGPLPQSAGESDVKRMSRTIREWRSAASRLIWRYNAAAPKVASDTGAGLREAERIARGWAEHFAGGDGDRRQMEKVCDDIADQIAALATDATDGATA